MRCKFVILKRYACTLQIKKICIKTATLCIYFTMGDNLLLMANEEHLHALRIKPDLSGADLSSAKSHCER